MQVGDRIEYEEYIGTIKYIGPVPKDAENEFIGVEWDEPSRGKHNGTFKGHAYFVTSHPTSGSFLKSSVNYTKPRDFTSALKEKYLLAEDTANDIEIFFGGDEKIVVETVGWNKVYQKQKRIDLLKEVGLAKRGVRYTSNDLTSVCPNITDLDLSKNLFVDYVEVAQICCQLPTLESLRLNYNRMSINGLVSLKDGLLLNAFANVTHLGLSATKLQWTEMLQIEKWFPQLAELNFGLNGLTDLTGIDCQVHFQKLTLLNLEYNSISNFQELSQLPNLNSLALNSNQISSIKYLDGFEKLSFLNLSNNLMQDWHSVHSLNFFPALTSLQFKHNQVLEPFRDSKKRYNLIARLKKLENLNKSPVTARDRQDAELYYLSLLLSVEVKDDAFYSDNPLFEELQLKYQDTAVTVHTKNTIKKDLVSLTIEWQNETFTKSVLERMTVMALKAVLSRMVKVKKFELIVETLDGRTFPMDDDRKELVFYSLDAKDLIKIQPL